MEHNTSEWHHILMCRLCAAIWTTLTCSSVSSSIIAWGSLSQHSWQRVWSPWDKHWEALVSVLWYAHYLLGAKLSRRPEPPWQVVLKEMKKRAKRLNRREEIKIILLPLRMVTGWFIFNLLYGKCCMVWTPSQVKLLCENYFMLAIGIFPKKNSLKNTYPNEHGIWC